jgi:hypothetical protein
MEVSGQHHAPAALPPGKQRRVQIWQEAGWAPEPFRTLWSRQISYPCLESSPSCSAPSLSLHLTPLHLLIVIMLHVYYNFRTFENEIPRGILGPKRGETIGGWRIHNNKTPYIIRCSRRSMNETVVFWDVVPFNLVDSHFQGIASIGSLTLSVPVLPSAYHLPFFPLGQFFYTEDEGMKFLRTVGTYLPRYTASCPSRQISQYSPPWELQIPRCWRNASHDLMRKTIQ